MNDERIRELERRSRAAFDESVEGMDAATRSRLARARSAALASALLLVGDDAAVPAAPPALAALEVLDIVAGGEDLGMFAEDEEFYAWAALEMEDGVG